MYIYKLSRRDVLMSSSPVSSPGGVHGAPQPRQPVSAFSKLGRPKSIAKQLAEATKADLPDRPTLKDLPKII
jgi:hypothetical protein